MGKKYQEYKIVEQIKTLFQEGTCLTLVNLAQIPQYSTEQEDNRNDALTLSMDMKFKSSSLYRKMKTGVLSFYFQTIQKKYCFFSKHTLKKNRKYIMDNVDKIEVTRNRSLSCCA